MKLFMIILIFLTCSGIQPVTGQTDPKHEASEDNNQEQPMEEVTVIGQRTLGTLRVQIDRAEDRMIDIYNKLNTDDLYDIHCSQGVATGSHIQRKTCAPVYFDRTEAETTQLALSGVPVGASYMNAKLTYYNPIMRAKWGQLAKSNPELLQAIEKHYQLSQELKNDRRAYFGLANVTDR